MLCCCCRDSHKGSERPGLGLETTEVSLFSNRMFWAAAAEGHWFHFFSLSLVSYQSGRRRNPSSGIMPHTNRQFGRPCLHVSMSWTESEVNEQKWNLWTYMHTHTHTHGVVGSSFQALICELIQNSWRSLLWLTPHFVDMVMCACIKWMHSFLTAKCTLFNHSCSSILQGF